MAVWGGLDKSAFEKLAKKLNSDTQELKQEFYESSTKEMGARLLARVKRRTPVGDYPSGTGKVGGTLRDSWKTSDVSYKNGTYTIDVYNPVEYAPYVEYGHRTRNHKGWVKGRFMMTESEVELREQMPRLLRQKFNKTFKGVLGGGK